MSSNPVIRLSTVADRDTILTFIERNGFNPRDAVTWDGLHMAAMTAWLDDQLIGAIPFEPRILQADGRTIRSIHETVVAVDAAHRGGGIGSKLQSALFSLRPFDAELVTVFREDPQSAAYRWYMKNGFVPLMNIQSWFCDQPASSDVPFQILKADDPAIPWQMFDVAKPPGRVIRPLRDWLAVHPYRSRYAFWVVATKDAAALLGVGRMHSATERADVLEWIAPDFSASAKLRQAIETAAAQAGWHPLRFSLSGNDPRTALLRDFESRWTFDMLGRNLADAVQLHSPQWHYSAIDYI